MKSLLSYGNNAKVFGFALSAWFFVASVTGYVSGVSLILDVLVAGNGSYILWPLVTLTLGCDIYDVSRSRSTGLLVVLDSVRSTKSNLLECSKFNFYS